MHRALRRSRDRFQAVHHSRAACRAPASPAPGRPSRASQRHQRRAPRKAAAHALQQHPLPGADLPGADELVERERHRRGRSVAVMIDGDDELFRRQAELARGSLENAHVRLVGDQPVDVLDRHVRGGQRLARRGLQHLDRKLEHALAVHLHERGADDAAVADIARHRQHVDLAAVGTQDAGVDARLRAFGKDHGAGAVAEQHARAAVVPVENAGEDFGADDQGALVLSRADEAGGGCQRVHETAADRLYVERCASLDTELRLQQAGGAWEEVGPPRGGGDEEGGGFGPDAGGVEGAPAGLQREIARALRWVGDVAFNDSRALPDPRVARVQALGKLAVRHDARRQVAAGAYDARIDHATGTCNCAIRVAILWGTLLRTSSTARSSAWPKANTSAEPWLLMTMPRRPSRLAPL